MPEAGGEAREANQPTGHVADVEVEIARLLLEEFVKALDQLAAQRRDNDAPGLSLAGEPGACDAAASTPALP